MFLSDFKPLFMKGLTALLPTVVTIALLVWAFNWINGHIASPITGLIITFMPKDPEFPLLDWLAEDDPLEFGQKIDKIDPVTGRQLTIEHEIIHHAACDSADPDVRKAARKRRAEAQWKILFTKFPLNSVGFLIAIALVYAIGFVLTGLIGRATLRMAESVLLRIPFIRAIYPNIKQVTDFLIGDRQYEFGGVVAVQYPRKGIWSVGLLTGQAMSTIEEHADSTGLVTIFIPSSPTPITGYTITVPKEDVIELAISLDEALRFTISGGVIRPPSEGGQPEMAMKDVSAGKLMLDDRKSGPKT